MNLIKQSIYDRNLEKGLKSIADMNTVIHCHHYNSRLQKTIEGNKRIDGARIIRESAAVVYSSLIENLIQKKSLPKNIEIADYLYSFLGFGKLNFSDINSGIITATDSHYVEGWKCGSVKHKGKVCRMTEGYLEGAFKAINNQDITVEEIECMNEEGVDCCKFKINNIETPVYDFNLSRFSDFEFILEKSTSVMSSNIDMKMVMEAIINMPLEGNNEGLIPAFNVYLAHTPQDFYNLISIKFVQAMSLIGLEDVASEMLTEDAENCALNTFGGILDSEEWAGLVKPMIRDEEDKMFGLVAVANGLGWGRINIKNLVPYERMTLTSSNGYEAYGNIEFQKYCSDSQCFMLKGVSAGLMGLLYGKGDFDDRAGKYESDEKLCLVKKDKICEFFVKLKE